MVIPTGATLCDVVQWEIVLNTVIGSGIGSKARRIFLTSGALCCVVVCDLETSRMGAPYIYMTLVT